MSRQGTFDNEVHLFVLVLANIATEHPASAHLGDGVAAVDGAAPHVANTVGINLCRGRQSRYDRMHSVVALSLNFVEYCSAHLTVGPGIVLFPVQDLPGREFFSHRKGLSEGMLYGAPSSLFSTSIRSTLPRSVDLMDANKRVGEKVQCACYLSCLPVVSPSKQQAIQG